MRKLKTWGARLNVAPAGTEPFLATLGLLNANGGACWCFDNVTETYCKRRPEYGPFCRRHRQQRLRLGPLPQNTPRELSLRDDQFVHHIHTYLKQIEVHPLYHRGIQGINPNALMRYRSTINLHVVTGRILTAYSYQPDSLLLAPPTMDRPS